LYETKQRSNDNRGNFSNRLSGWREDWARANEMEAQRDARPNSGSNFSRVDPRIADAILDQPPTAVETPNGPPQSPEPHNTDA